MRAKELVPILAERWAVPFETAFTIDRALMNAGLREKGRGRAYPDMTREEALLFLFGCMAAEKATQAADDVKAWQSATGLFPFDPSEKTVDDQDEHYDPVESRRDGERAHYFKLISPKLEPLAPKRGKIPMVGMMNFLLVVCDLIGRAEIDQDCVRFSITTSHQTAELELLNYRGDPVVTHHFTSPAHTIDHYDDDATQIRRTFTVSGHALGEICFRTDNPLAEAD